MKNFSYKSKIKLNLLMLKIAGLWPNEDTYKLNFYTIYAIISNFVFEVLHQGFQFMYLVSTADFEATAQSLLMQVIQWLTLLKAYYFTKNIKTLKFLVNSTEQEIFQPKNTTQREIADKNFAFWAAYYNLMWGLCICAMFFWATYPLYDASENDYRLPLLSWYPFNYKQSPFYQIVYVHQMVSNLFIIISNLDMDTLIAALNVYTGTQFDILCDDLKSLHLSTKDSFVVLTRCINHHKNILRFAETYNNFIGWIIVFQFFTSVVTLAFAMFRLTIIAPLSNEFYSIIFYTNAVLSEIFVYCWFGNEITVKSSNIPYAIFSSDWIEAPLNIQKDLVYFMMKGQWSLKISALNLFDLSLSTFVVILKSSWSYFALVKNISVQE